MEGTKHIKHSRVIGRGHRSRLSTTNVVKGGMLPSNEGSFDSPRLFQDQSAV